MQGNKSGTGRTSVKVVVALVVAMLGVFGASAIAGAQNGANTCTGTSAYCATTPVDTTKTSGNGLGGGNATGQPCAGCVGNADSKNPPGQLPGPSGTNGYECDKNNGIALSNPAHTGCRPASPPPVCANPPCTTPTPPPVCANPPCTTPTPPPVCANPPCTTPGSTPGVTPGNAVEGVSGTPPSTPSQGGVLGAKKSSPSSTKSSPSSAQPAAVPTAGAAQPVSRGNGGLTG